MTQIAISTKSLVNIQEVRRAYDLLVEPGQVVEIRALEASRDYNSRYTETLAGYFDNFADLAKEIATIKRALGIYVTLQVCDEELINRAYNRLVKQQKNASTSDRDVTRYRWLAIDCDPDRKAGISATDEEHKKALALAKNIRDEMSGASWPQPIYADSGNGSHLLYRVDLPATESSLVKRVLEGLAVRFDEDHVHVDQTLFNPSRIIKLYGTLACKGDNTPKRPHRLSRILEMPDALQIIPRDLLEAIATPVQPVQISQPKQSYNVTGEHEEFTAEKFLAKHSITVKSQGEYQGGTRYMLDACAWAGHTDSSACVYQFSDGRLGASCSHNSCKGKGWRDFRLVFEPDTYTKQKKNAKAKTDDDKTDTGDNEEKKPSTITLLLRIAKDATFIRTPKGELYARVGVNGHYEVISINERGSGFRRWLTYRFQKQHGYPANSDALSQAMSTVQAIAEYEGEKTPVFTKIAEKDGKIYLDLCNDNWECVEISSIGWKVVACPPVYFRRHNGMLPLPHPTRGGDIRSIKRLVNTKNDSDLMLISAWLVGTLHPKGPYTALNITGEKGSAKSYATKMLRNIVDPHEAYARSSFADKIEAAIAAQNNMIVALDNLSTMPLWLSDALCRIATGAGDAKRTLYTDGDETIFNAKCPIIINGIEDGLITQSDLLSRTMIVTLEPPEEYLTEEEVDELFTELHPSILGALLDAVVMAVRDRRHVEIGASVRMADFARWVTAAEPAMGWDRGTFVKMFLENQDDANSIVTDASTVARAIIQFLDNHPEGWSGLMSDLHNRLGAYDVYTKAKDAPKSPNRLSGQLKRVAPPLRSRGINIVGPYRGKHGSMVSITLTPTKKDGVDTGVGGVGQTKRPTPLSTPPSSILSVSSNHTGVGGVGQMDTLSSSSSHYPSIEEKRIEREREKADSVPILPTPSTPSVQDMARSVLPVVVNEGVGQTEMTYTRPTPPTPLPTPPTPDGIGQGDLTLQENEDEQKTTYKRVQHDVFKHPTDTQFVLRGTSSTFTPYDCCVEMGKRIRRGDTESVNHFFATYGCAR